MNPLSQQKAFHTALIISPPVSTWPSIQNIRKFNDSAYQRWMPHINMCFPFVSEKEFDIAFDLLQENLKDFAAFPIEFKTLSFFKHEKNCVLWLKPDVFNDELTKLEDIIVKTLPFCDDLLKKSKENEGFIGHLTLGQFDEKIIEKKREKFEKKWKSFSFMVNEIHLIFRKNAESPFIVLKTLKLKNAEDLKENQAELINKEMKSFEKEFYQTNAF